MLKLHQLCSVCILMYFVAVPVHFLDRSLQAASTGVMMTSGDICSGFPQPCAARCPNDLACREHTVWVKSETVSQCEDGYDEKSAGCSRRFQFTLISFCLDSFRGLRYGLKDSLKCMGRAMVQALFCFSHTFPALDPSSRQPKKNKSNKHLIS